MAFENATAVVTGGASGLGRAFCEELARKGGRILIGDVNVQGAEETAARVRQLGGEARVEACDVREPGQVEALAKAADEWLKATDVLINNAGVAVGGHVGDVSLEDWKWQVDINLWGVIYGCHFWAPRMKARGHGHIINVASAAGLLTLPEMGPYNVAKAGVVALSETMYPELEPEGVHVTVLCPTFFRTNIHRAARGPAAESAVEGIERVMDKSRIQAPDVARLALDHVRRGKLYCVPMRDGRLMWRIKRATPRGFYGLLSRVAGKEGARKLIGLE